jgi:hypothetical protein
MLVHCVRESLAPSYALINIISPLSLSPASWQSCHIWLTNPHKPLGGSAGLGWRGAQEGCRRGGRLGRRGADHALGLAGGGAGCSRSPSLTDHHEANEADWAGRLQPLNAHTHSSPAQRSPALLCSAPGPYSTETHTHTQRERVRKKERDLRRMGTKGREGEKQSMWDKEGRDRETERYRERAREKERENEREGERVINRDTERDRERKRETERERVTLSSHSVQRVRWSQFRER